MLITGKVEINDYKDKEGVERKIIDINVDSFGGVELLGNKTQQENGTNNDTSNNSDLLIDIDNDDDLTVIDYGDMPF